MPYKEFEKVIDGQKRYCIKNIRTGKVTCYYSSEKREIGIKMKEAFAHGFKPTRLKKSTIVRRHRRKGRKVIKHRRKLR